MKSLLVLLVVFVLVAACGGGAASTLVKSAAPPGPLTKYRNTLSGLNANKQIDLIQNVIDFAPGTASVVHVHTSPNLATLLQGQITVKTPAGADRRASSGGQHRLWRGDRGGRIRSAPRWQTNDRGSGASRAGAPE